MDIENRSSAMIVAQLAAMERSGTILEQNYGTECDVHFLKS